MAEKKQNVYKIIITEQDREIIRKALISFYYDSGAHSAGDIDRAGLMLYWLDGLVPAPKWVEPTVKKLN